MKPSPKPLSITVAVLAALAIPAASALAHGSAVSRNLASPQSPAPQNPPAPQDEATPYIGFVAATPEGKLLASNVPVAAAGGDQPRMMVLRRDGTPVSPEESGLKVVRNPDGTITVQRAEKGEAGTVTQAPPSGNATAAEQGAASGREAPAPASDAALQFTEFVVDDDTEVVGTLVPGMPVKIDYEEVDGVKIARRIEVNGG